MNLTKPQKLIYDMEKFAGGSISVICGSYLCKGNKSIDELQNTVNKIFCANDALRIHIKETDGKPYQEITTYQEQKFEVLNFSTEQELNLFAENYAKEPIDLYGSLCDAKIIILPDSYGLIIKLHHLIGDAWTLALLGSQFNELLNENEIVAYSYKEYAVNEEKYLNSKRFKKDKSFFLEQFKKCDEATYLSEKQATTFCAERKSFIINNENTKYIIDYADKNNISVFTLFITTLSIYFNRTHMNSEKFYVGTAVLNRTGVKEKNTAGMFINTVPVLINLDNEKSFMANAENVQNSILSTFRHQKYNYSDVLSDIREKYNFTEKLYDVMLSYQNAKITGATESFKSKWYHSGSQTESLQIHIDDRDSDGIFKIHYDYQTEKFTEQEIEMMHEHFMSLLLDAAANPEKKLYELQLLTKAEQRKLLYDFNNTAVDYPRDKCVHQLFEEQAKKTPDKVAVIACDKTLTYCELNEQANRIAHGLIEKGIGVGDIVAFALPRKSYLIAAMFGILKSGAAYLPIDPDYPQDRIKFILSDSKARLFITEKNIISLLSNQNLDNPMVPMSSNDLCYCIYTSGSTGQPKGVMLHHYNISNYVSNNNNNIVHSIIKEEYISIVSVTTCGFDIFVTESILPLVNGMWVLLANAEQAKIQISLNQLLNQHPVDVMQTTPSKIKSLIADLSKTDFLKKLKVLILGGEALDGTLLSNLRRLTNAEIFNIYGPTETTVWSSNANVTEITNRITIGKPIANTQIYIVDQYMQPVPIGVTGELCIAGDGVGAGYLNRPELTAEKFINNPFGEGKLYKTGDLAYWREDGNIVYVGRNDFQVKIRGLRIELGEIENAICGVDGISQAVVVVRKNAEGRQLICAFYTGVETDAKDIRAKIGEKLPKYMLPHIFTHLDAMPLTGSGKINRKALPEINLENISNDTAYVAPENQQQKELCKLIESVLRTTPVGITDDFFDLGGDSLKAIEYVSKAHNEGIYFNLQNVFDYPTVKQLCECIENGDKQNVSFADVDFSKVNEILSKNTVENMIVPQKCDVGNILLAGATGYLGIHILANYLDNDSGVAYCLVRGKDKSDSVKRLKDLLDFYFGDKYIGMHRIEVICADLQKDKFGLADKEYENLFSKVDTVINCAASVKHYGSYKYFYEANVETTKRLIDFCKLSNARLIHTSTLSVSGNSLGDQFDGYISETEKHFYECNLYIDQPLDNVYGRSKFEAEKEILDAMMDGLNANIMRMGNLTNRLSDGVFQRNHESNAFLQRVKGVFELGLFPDYLIKDIFYAEFTPIDEAADAVMTIARHFSTEQTVFHINSVNVVHFDKLMRIFNQLGIDIKTVSGKEFTEALRATAKQSGMEHIFETFINDMDKNDQLNYDSNIRIENDFTVQYLKKLGFEWSQIGFEYIKKYINYFRSIEFFTGDINNG